MANNVLAFDIETKNLSNEIGGWNNTHMFLVSTVATWDGDIAKVYVDEPDNITKGEYQILPMSQLKYDLDNHFEKGGKLLGHNIAGFDLPVLRDSLDIYCISKYFKHRQYIDTSQLITKACGERIALQNVIDHTLGESKLLESHDAPALWKMGEYDKVIKYCLSDSKLVYDLWIAGKSDTIKAFSINNKEIIDIEVKW
tara:strand:- start:472 stop:1065 length:594 start_codon:yes stop_codon:yes gene_type:complete